MKLIALFVLSFAAFGQSNAIQLCDQQSPRHCLTIKVPATMAGNSTATVGPEGWTIPAQFLKVQSESTGLPRGVMSEQYSSSTDSAIFYSRKARGSIASPSSVNNADILLNVRGDGYDGSAYVQSGMMRFEVVGSVSSGHVPGQIAFYTAPAGTAVERLRITDTDAKFTQNVIPSVTNTYTLGDSSHRWDLYARNIDFSGTITGTFPYLPLAGGTMTGSILGSATGQDVGSAAGYFRDAYYSGTVEGTKLRAYAGTPASVTDYFDWITFGSHSFGLQDSSGSTVIGVSSLAGVYTIQENAHIVPAAGNTFDLGASGAKYRKLYLNSALDMNGTSVIDGSLNGTFAGLTGSGTITFSGITGATRCLQVNTSGVVSGTSGACASSALFLPLAGGTMTGSILGNATGLDIGSSADYFRDAYYSGTVEGTKLRAYAGTPASVTDYFDWITFGLHSFGLQDSTGTTVIGVVNPSGRYSMTVLGDVFPSAGNTYDLGGSGAKYRKLYLNSALDMNGTSVIDGSGNVNFFSTLQASGTVVIDASRNFDAVSYKISGTTVVDSSRNGAFAAIGATSVTNFTVGSGNFYMRTISGAPSCMGVTDGWIGYDTTGDVIYVCNGGVAKAH